MIGYWLLLAVLAACVTAPIYAAARWKRPAYSRRLAAAASVPLGAFVFLWGGFQLMLSVG